MDVLLTYMAVPQPPKIHSYMNHKAATFSFFKLGTSVNGRSRRYIPDSAGLKKCVEEDILNCSVWRFLGTHLTGLSGAG